MRALSLRPVLESLNGANRLLAVSAERSLLQPAQVEMNRVLLDFRESFVTTAEPSEGKEET